MKLNTVHCIIMSQHNVPLYENCKMTYIALKKVVEGERGIVVKNGLVNPSINVIVDAFKGRGWNNQGGQGGRTCPRGDGGE